MKHGDAEVKLLDLKQVDALASNEKQILLGYLIVNFVEIEELGLAAHADPVVKGFFLNAYNLPLLDSLRPGSSARCGEDSAAQRFEVMCSHPLLLGGP
ncbi:hypothetical protein JTF08_03290 [Micrococcaceae bacterium RIT802]|nr:hypothetical protein [Micrococcaceae bacterium RIT 802]